MLLSIYKAAANWNSKIIKSLKRVILIGGEQTYRLQLKYFLYSEKYTLLFALCFAIGVLWT